jgi:hypothetical protein
MLSSRQPFGPGRRDGLCMPSCTTGDCRIPGGSVSNSGDCVRGSVGQSSDRVERVRSPLGGAGRGSYGAWDRFGTISIAAAVDRGGSDREKSGRQFEPDARPCIDEASARVTSHIASHEAKTRLEGWEVIEAWAILPEPLRAAILAIVRSHTGATGKRSAQPVPPEPHGLRGGVSPSPLPERGAPFQNGKRREAK